MAIRVIKKIEIMPFSIIISITSAVVGFIYALVIMVPMGLLLSTMPTRGMGGMMAGFGLAAVVLYPAFIWISVFITSALFAIIYNSLAPKINGIQIEVD